MSREIVQIQEYAFDEWLISECKTLEDVKAEAKQFGNAELKKMYFRSSDFDEIYYYIDSMGHHILFRCVTIPWTEEFLIKDDAKVLQRIGRMKRDTPTQTLTDNSNSSEVRAP